MTVKNSIISQLDDKVLGMIRRTVVAGFVDANAA